MTMKHKLLFLCLALLGVILPPFTALADLPQSQGPNRIA